MVGPGAANCRLGNDNDNQQVDGLYLSYNGANHPHSHSGIGSNTIASSNLSSSVCEGDPIDDGVGRVTAMVRKLLLKTVSQGFCVGLSGGDMRRHMGEVQVHDHGLAHR